jgi:23S rRNA (adenine2503-C2)-methyltransferase
VLDRTRRSERYIAVRELNAAEDLPQIAVNRI